MAPTARAMRPIRFIALAVALGLTACEGGQSYRIHNATRSEVTVRRGAYWFMPETKRIAPGQKVKFYLNGHEISVAREGCVASYVLPKLYVFNHPFRTADGSDADSSYPYPVEVRLANNFELQLLDKAGLDVPRGPVDRSLKSNFPLKPKAVTCSPGGA